MIKKITIGVLLVSFLMIGLVQSQTNDLPDPGILPDSPFYFLKSWSEGIGTLLTFGEGKRAERSFNLSERRLSEVKALAEKERGDIAERIIDKYEEQLNSAIQKAEKAKEKGKDMDDLLERISERTLKHQEVLADVYEKVSEEAKEAIERAMKNGMRGHEEALRAVSQERSEEIMERIESKREEARQRMDEARERGVPVPDIPTWKDGEFVFVCSSGDEIRISYGEETEEAYLSFQDKEYNLHRTISASGARYANEDEKVVFWEHQGEAMVEIDGERLFENCVLQEDFENEEAIRQVVNDFGRQLKNISLSAPEEQVREDMEKYYGDLVVYETIKKWFKNPLEAPGRLTSSPWPEKIEINSVSKETEEKYLVKGRIIEITSIEESEGGKAAERSIDIYLAKFDGTWLITGISLGDYFIVYTNDEYGFSFSLPRSWEGYSIINSTWEGFVVDSHEEMTEEGPMLSIRHPDWTIEEERQDIPIMIFTINQWNDMQEGYFHIGAAPTNPRELGRNDNYVFALPARYNYAFPEGFEEVDDIIENNPLEAF